MAKYVQVWNRILSQKIIGSWNESFRIPIISTVREVFMIRKMYILAFIHCVSWAKFWQSYTSNDIKCIIRLWAEAGYSSLITHKFDMISRSIFRPKLVKHGCCHVLMTCIMTYGWTQYCWLLNSSKANNTEFSHMSLWQQLKMIIICGKWWMQVIITLDVTGRNQ